jgi:hypothetical protein
MGGGAEGEAGEEGEGEDIVFLFERIVEGELLTNLDPYCGRCVGVRGGGGGMYSRGEGEARTLSSLGLLFGESVDAVAGAGPVAGMGSNGGMDLSIVRTVRLSSSSLSPEEEEEEESLKSSKRIESTSTSPCEGGRREALSILRKNGWCSDRGLIVAPAADCWGCDRDWECCRTGLCLCS